MSLSLYEEVIVYVDQSFGWHNPHFERTVFWLKEFLPNCGEAECIAAYSHDIERAFRPKDKKEPDDYRGADFLAYHQEEWARLMSLFLEGKGASSELIERVSHLISRNEVGWDDDQNIFMDADSVSFFETTAERFVRDKVSTQGYEKIKPKLEWMYGRIHSEIAREEARGDYEYWMSELEKMK